MAKVSDFILEEEAGPYHASVDLYLASKTGFPDSNTKSLNASPAVNYLSKMFATFISRNQMLHKNTQNYKKFHKL